MRTSFIAGNWKMFTTAAVARRLAADVVAGLSQLDGVRVAICPPYPYLAIVSETIRGSRVGLGAQNLYPEKEGAYTGEVSPTMLRDLGCEYVIIGHSERRHKLGETNEFIRRKLQVALASELKVIFCVGETLQERQANRTESVLDQQLAEGLREVNVGAPGRLVLAYEPVWAIGTGHNAAPEQAQSAHAFLRRRFSEHFGRDAADELCIQYGGSVKPENAAQILAQPDVDGALVGGASLKADQFLAIVRAGLVKIEKASQLS
jgi:triosephosphate isomerase